MKKKQIYDIGSYMKQRQNGTYDPFSLNEFMFDEITEDDYGEYSVFYEDNGRLDLICLVCYGSDKYEELVMYLNKIRDQFEDLPPNKKIKIINPVKLFELMENSNKLI